MRLMIQLPEDLTVISVFINRGTQDLLLIHKLIPIPHKQPVITVYLVNLQ